MLITDIYVLKKLELDSSNSAEKTCTVIFLHIKGTYDMHNGTVEDKMKKRVTILI